MSQENGHETFKKHLQDQGYSPADIELIISRVADYDRRILRDCVFESLEDGSIEFEELSDNPRADKWLFRL